MFHQSTSFMHRLLPHKELQSIYLSSAIRAFGISLLGIFLPLYLYHELNFGLSITLGYYILNSIIFAVITPFAAQYAAKYGLKHAILLSVPPYVLFAFLLYQNPSPFDLILSSIALGVSLAFYWMGMNVLFQKISHKKLHGTENAKKLAYSMIAAMLGPIIGGFIIQTTSFSAVFLLSAFAMVISSIILFSHTEQHIPFTLHLKEVASPVSLPSALFMVSHGALTMTQSVLWPLFIFLFLGTYFQVGFLTSFLALLSTLIILVMGKLSDSVNKHRIIQITSIIDSALYIFTTYARTITHLLILVVCNSFIHATRDAPLLAYEMDNAKKNIVAYFANREVYLCIGRVLLLSIVLLTEQVTHGFITQAILNIALIIA